MFSIVLLDVPSAPTNLIRIKSTNSSITIRWGVPTEAGYRPIITYFLETESSNSSRNGTNQTVIGGGSAKYEHTFGDLQAKTNYTVRVSAYNLVGRGAEAMEIYETIPYTLPGW